MDVKGEEGNVDASNSENIMQGEKVIAPKPKEHWSDKKKKFVIWGGAGLVVVLLVLALVFGFMSVVFKLPEQKVAVISNVCGESTVNAYNDAVDGYLTENRSKSTETISNIVNNFSKNASYESDSNCLFIKYQMAYSQADYTTAKDMLDKLTTQVKKGRSVDGRMKGLSSISNMETALGSIRPTTGIDNDDN